MSGVRGELQQQRQPGAPRPPAALLTRLPLQVLPRRLLQLPGTHQAHQQVPPVREPAGDLAAGAAPARLLILGIKSKF